MLTSTRRALLVLLGVGMLGGLSLWQASLGENMAAAQGIRVIGKPIGPGGGPDVQPDPNEPNDQNSVLTLVTNPRIKAKIEAGREYIDGKVKDWPKATHLLQGVLNEKQDAFVPITTKGVDGKEQTQFISAKGEATRLIGTMPAEGMDWYKNEVGPTAQAMLNEAMEKSDVALLAEIAQRFLYTDAGNKATTLLATHQLDRGDYTAAALRFKALMLRDGPDKLQPLTLFKAALAFHSAGDAENEAIAWKTLEAKAGSGEELTLGGNKTVSLKEAKELLDKFQRSTAGGNASDWLQVRGNNARNGQGHGGIPFTSPDWHLSMFHGNKDGQVAKWIADAVRMQDAHNQPSLPAFQPIAVKVRGDKGVKSMVIYRNYWGITAVDIKNGMRLWDSASDWSMERMVEKPERLNALNQWVAGYIQNQTKPSIVFENSTIGTLSSDGTRVYMVEDLAVPPPFFQNFNNWGGMQPPPQMRYGKEIDDAVAHSQLYAYDLYTGLLKWRLGGRVDPKEDKTHPNFEVKDSYFLGPPLALGGKLYVMTDKNQELRMVCINAAKGEVEWAQPLANTREKMVQDVNRRVQAAQLSYGDGVLVCPTNSGAILGVDLLSHSLLWAYPYREKALEGPKPGFPGGGPGFGPGGMGPPGNPLATDWQVTPPVIVDGKVVFTAPDASSLHCIDLRKGTYLWKEVKGERDLYLAGVYDGKVLVVTKDNVRALSLDKGKKLWELPTGLPSGQGVAADNFYYLPLKGSASDKDRPEICAINVKAGKIEAHTKSRKRPGTQTFEMPGNLLMFEGDVLSQGLSEIMAFPQLEFQEQQAEILLAKNPKDPVGLTKRGELRLDKGKRLEAVADLREALAQKEIDADTTRLARLKLYESLTELMTPEPDRNEFPKAEPYLAEYEELCRNPAGSGVTDIAAEKDRRLINYYCLLAKGREAQEKYTDAFQAYMDFIALTANKKDELVNTADEVSVRSAPDVWAAGRIAAMMGNAKGPSKKPFEDKIAERWTQSSEKGDVASLRQFVAMFGSQFAVGREARLQLAERLMEEAGTTSLLDAERHLIMLQGQQDDRTMAARAVETHARLLKRKGMLAEAAYQYKILSREFPTEVIRDGKTGADFFNDLAADKFLLPYLDGQHFVLAGKLQVKADAGNFQQTQNVFNFECDAESSPFFDKHRLAYNINFQKFQLLDRQTGEEKWGQRLNNVVYFQNFLWGNGMSDKKRFPFQRVGHLVVLNMGNMIFGLDPVNKQVLWEKNLLGAQGQPLNTNLWLNPADDMIEIMYPNNYREAIGHGGPAEASYVAILSRDGLLAIDPITGRTLWTRTGIGPRSHLFGDTQHVYVVEVNADGQNGKAYALRASDGVKLDKAPDFGDLYAKRIQTLGRNLLLSETDAAKKLTLRLYDIPTGKDVWKEEFPAGSVAIHSEERDLVGAVEATGKVTLFDLRSRKAVFEAKVDPRFLKDVNDVRLFLDSRNYYLALNTPLDANANPGGMSYSNIQPQTGMRCTPINGEFYCFNRDTKKMEWHNDIPMTRLLVDHFQDLPMVLFTSRNNRPAPKGGGWGGQDVAVTSIDKATGKRIYDKTDLPQDYQQFYDMKVDLKNGKIELVGWNFKVTHTVVPADGAAGDGKKESGPTPPSGDGSGPGTGGGTTPIPIKRGDK